MPSRHRRTSSHRLFLTAAGLQVLIGAGLCIGLPASAPVVLLITCGGMLILAAVVAIQARRHGEALRRLAELLEAAERGDVLPTRQTDDELAEMASGLRRLSETLSERGAERDRLQRRIERCEKLALLGELAATAAHEINNPLDGLQSSTRIIRRSLSDEQRVRQMLDLMDGGLYRIEMIVRRLLAMSRDEPPVCVELPLAELMNEAAALAGPRLERCGVVLIKELPDERLSVLGDRLQLAQALINLLINGADAMASGGKLILRGRQEGETAVLEVIDTGCGIATQHLPHIFEPFYTTKPGGRGTGLGLAVVHRVVEAHGGGIQVFSQPGRGTRFRMELPSARTRPEIPAPAAPARRPPSLTQIGVTGPLTTH